MNESVIEADLGPARLCCECPVLLHPKSAKLDSVWVTVWSGSEN